MISAGQLAANRAIMSKLLTDTVEHWAKTDTVSASYATTQGYANQGILPCLIYSAQGSKAMSSEIADIGGSTADVAPYVIRLPWDAGVRVGDKLIKNSDEFLVTSDGDSDTNRFLLQVGAQRIRGDK